MDCIGVGCIRNLETKSSADWRLFVWISDNITVALAGDRCPTTCSDIVNAAISGYNPGVGTDFTKCGASQTKRTCLPWPDLSP